MSEAETPKPNAEQSDNDGREYRWNPWFSEENMSHERRKFISKNKYNLKSDDSWLGDTFRFPRLRDNGHGELLLDAKRAMERDFKGHTRNNVTDFTSWIFELEHKPRDAAKKSGRQGESIVQKWKRALSGSKIYDTGWTRIFFDNLDGKQEGLKISALKVNDAPMFGLPDYVLFNAALETVLIVEVKTSWKELPIDGWPNLRAQLWAYAHLDFIVEKKPKNVILIGEVWIFDEKRPYLQKTYRWDMSDIRFCEENEELFACYQQYASF